MKIILITLTILLLLSCDNNNKGVKGKIISSTKDELKVEIIFDMAQHKTIQEYIFNVDERLESLDFSYQDLDHDGDAIDFGLATDDKIIGWSGGAKKEVFISDNYSSTGYNRLVIEKGQYKALFGVYGIKNNSAKVLLTIKKTRPAPRWLYGSTHMHSLNSDGKFMIEENVKRSLANNFNYMFITDHNTTVGIKEAYPFASKDLLIIPGVEWTSWKGHANFAGIEDPLGDNGEFRWFDEGKDYKHYFENARKNGAFIGLNHPIDKGDSTWAWTWPSEEEYDYIELWNAVWEKEYDGKVLEWWKGQLDNGKIIPAIGSSDFHRNAEGYDAFILPVNKVLSSGFSKLDLLTSIKAGKSIMFDKNMVEDVLFTSEKGLIGERTKENKVIIDVKNLDAGCTIKLVSDKTTIVVASNVANFNKTVKVDFDKYCYLQISKDDKMVAISNPIYR